MEILNQELILAPDNVIVISKQGAKEFHSIVKHRIKETGYGLFEYIELIKFFEKLSKVLSGDSASKNEDEKAGDKELKDMIRTEIVKYGKAFTTSRGVKFELVETGTKYDYNASADFVLPMLESQAESLKERIKLRQEFLKTIPKEGMELLNEETGEMERVFPPVKTSTSSFKTTLPK